MIKKFPDLIKKHQVKLRNRSGARKPAIIGEIKTSDPAAFAIRLLTNRLEYLGLYQGMIIEVVRRPLAALDLSKPVVIQDSNKKFYCGFLVNAFEMFAFEDGRGNIERTFMPTEIFAAGQITRAFDENNEVLWTLTKTKFSDK